MIKYKLTILNPKHNEKQNSSARNNHPLSKHKVLLKELRNYFTNYSCGVIILFERVYVGLHFLSILLEN